MSHSENSTRQCSVPTMQLKGYASLCKQQSFLDVQGMWQYRSQRICPNNSICAQITYQNGELRPESQEKTPRKMSILRYRSVNRWRLATSWAWVVAHPPAPQLLPEPDKKGMTKPSPQILSPPGSPPKSIHPSRNQCPAPEICSTASSVSWSSIVSDQSTDWPDYRFTVYAPLQVLWSERCCGALSSHL